MLVVSLTIVLSCSSAAYAAEEPGKTGGCSQREFTGPDTITTRTAGITFKLIPAGQFQMGSGQNDKHAVYDEKPQHLVRITRPFYLGVTEVTQSQYKAVMGDNPSWFSAKGGGRDKVGGPSTDQHPVENVSWIDAVKFCNRLSELEGRPAFYAMIRETVRVPDWKAKGYRLPTEAEWEYACAGDSTNLGDQAWSYRNSGSATHAVGRKRANRFGLHDMLGNVWEWCWDAYDENYYKHPLGEDPVGPDAGAAALRVFRGGGWFSDPRYCRAAIRNWGTPVLRYDYVGIRLALVLKQA
jgi:formylglycine-generating enzyme required for sulfatase activity